VSGGASWTNDAKIGGALRLADGDDKILVSPAVALQTNWALCAWFKAPLPNTGTWHTMFRAQNGDHQIIADSSLNLGMYDNASGGGFRGCGYSLGGLSNGWHHVAAVGSGSTTAFYVDGASVGTSDRKSSTDVYAVGNYQGDSQRFAEKIDDVRIYNRALSSAEILQLANPAPQNRAPAVTLAASLTNGVAPLAVAFTANGSDLDGDTLAYSWAFGDGSTNKPGGTSAIAHTYLAAGTYTAIVTADDGRGGVSTAAVLVRVQPWSSGFGFGPGASPQVSFLTATGWVYSVEYKDDLLSTNGWRVLTNNISGSGGRVDIPIDSGPAAQRYYRTKAQQP
jgi:hypothetical protein